MAEKETIDGDAARSDRQRSVLGPRDVCQIQDRWNWRTTETSSHRQTHSIIPPADNHEALESSSKSSVHFQYNPKHLPSVRKRWRQVTQSEAQKSEFDGKSEAEEQNVSSESSPMGRCSHSLTPVQDDFLLLLGGGYYSTGSERFIHLDDLWMLNATTSLWTQLQPRILPSPPRYRRPIETETSYWGMEFGPPRRAHMSAYDENSGHLVVFGGVTTACEKEQLLGDVWVLDVTRVLWRKLKPECRACEVPRPRRSGISWVDKDYFFLVGGYISVPRDDHGVILYKLGPLSSPVHEWAWTMQETLNGCVLLKRAPNWPTVTVSPRPQRTLSYCPHAIIGRKLWIFGGLDYSMGLATPGNLFHRLDLDHWEWVTVSVPRGAPSPRYCHGMVSLGRFLIVAGGSAFFDRGDNSAVADVAVDDEVDILDDDDDDEPAVTERTIFDLYLFDTEALKWKQEHPSSVPGDWPRARNAFAMVRFGTSVVLHGGGVHPSTYYDDTYALEFDLPIKLPKSKGSATTEVCHDMRQLFQSGMLSDLTLVAGEGTSSRSFSVHKAILAARCDFFRTMLTGPYAEATSSEIRIPEADADAVHIVLQFLYTGTVDAQSFVDKGDVEAVSATMNLADVWGVTTLTEKLENALATAMRSGKIDTIELILFAKAHNCKRLALQGLEYAKQTWDTLQSSPSFLEADPVVVEEIRAFVHSLL